MIADQPKPGTVEKFDMTNLSDMERGYKTAEILLTNGELNQLVDFIQDQARLILFNRATKPAKQVVIQRANGDTGPIIGAVQREQDLMADALNTLVGASMFVAMGFFQVKEAFAEFSKQQDKPGEPANNTKEQ